MSSRTSTAKSATTARQMNFPGLGTFSHALKRCGGPRRLRAARGLARIVASEPGLRHCARTLSDRPNKPPTLLGTGPRSQPRLFEAFFYWSSLFSATLNGRQWQRKWVVGALTPSWVLWVGRRTPVYAGREPGNLLVPFFYNSRGTHVKLRGYLV